MRVPHPFNYTADEWQFLAMLSGVVNGLTGCLGGGHGPLEVSRGDYERLEEMLGRFPDYERGEDGARDYGKPIALNVLFTTHSLPQPNLLFKGIAVIPLP